MISANWQRAYVFLGLIAILFAKRAHAFEGWEHKDSANIAFAASAHWLATLTNSNADVTARIASARQMTQRFLAGIPNERHTDKPISYGEIVRLVDYMTDNYELLHSPDNGSDWITERDQRWTSHYLGNLAPNMVAAASAAHANQNHFQGRAMHTFWFWHLQAVALAQAGNLYGALLMNAYADHFLQDTFAPGHIVVPRDRDSHDLTALAIHDAYNEKGMNYILNAPQQLSESISMLIPINDHGVRIVKDTAREMAAYTGTNMTVRCYGDGKINENPQQAILVTAYAARSVRDVIESFIQAQAVNSFPSYEWRIHYAEVYRPVLGVPVPRAHAEFIKMGYYFGKLECQETNINPNHQVRMGDHLTADHMDAPVTVSLLEPARKNLVFGGSAGMHTLLDDDGAHAQSMIEAEMMLAGDRWDYLKYDRGDRWWIPNWPDQCALTLGYSGILGGHTSAHGFITRAVFPVAALNLQVSLVGGMRQHTRGSLHEWADFEGVRLEWGYHLAGFFVGMGRDHRYLASGKLDDGFAFQAGMSLAFPISRPKNAIKHFFDDPRKP